MSFFTSSSRPHYSSRSHSTPTGHSSTYTRSKSGGVTSSPYASFFGSSGSYSSSRGRGSSTSYYRRSPRGGYVNRVISKLKKILRDLYRYIRAHPVKVLLPLIMALLSSGALGAAARSMGVSMPQAFMNIVGAGQSAKGGYDAWAGDSMSGGDAGGGLMKGAMKMAAAFM